MRILLLALLVGSLLAVGCIRLGGIAVPEGKAGGQVGAQSASDNTGLAQNPGGLQSLPGVPVSPNIGQFNLPAQGSSQSQGMGALPASGQAGNQPNVGMAALKKNLPVFDEGWQKGFWCDSFFLILGEAVILTWNVSNAESLDIKVDGGWVKSDLASGQFIPVPPGKIAAVVVPQSVGKYVFTLTATNSDGSVSRSRELLVGSVGQGAPWFGSDRMGTFMVYPERVKRGVATYVYWNVRNADHVYIETNTPGSYGAPDPRDRVLSYGVEAFYPLENTYFILRFGNGEYLEKSGSKNPDYGTRTLKVIVE